MSADWQAPRESRAVVKTGVKSFLGCAAWRPDAPEDFKAEGWVPDSGEDFTAPNGDSITWKNNQEWSPDLPSDFQPVEWKTDDPSTWNVATVEFNPSAWSPEGGGYFTAPSPSAPAWKGKEDSGKGRVDQPGTGPMQTPSPGEASVPRSSTFQQSEWRPDPPQQWQPDPSQGWTADSAQQWSPDSAQDYSTGPVKEWNQNAAQSPEPQQRQQGAWQPDSAADFQPAEWQPDLAQGFSNSHQPQEQSRSFKAVTWQPDSVDDFQTQQWAPDLSQRPPVHPTQAAERYPSRRSQARSDPPGPDRTPHGPASDLGASAKPNLGGISAANATGQPKVRQSSAALTPQSGAVKQQSQAGGAYQGAGRVSDRNQPVQQGLATAANGQALQFRAAEWLPDTAGRVQIGMQLAESQPTSPIADASSLQPVMKSDRQSAKLRQASQFQNPAKASGQDHNSPPWVGQPQQQAQIRTADEAHGRKSISGARLSQSSARVQEEGGAKQDDLSEIHQSTSPTDHSQSRQSQLQSPAAARRQSINNTQSHQQHVFQSPHQSNSAPDRQSFHASAPVHTRAQSVMSHAPNGVDTGHVPSQAYQQAPRFSLRPESSHGASETSSSVPKFHAFATHQSVEPPLSHHSTPDERAAGSTGESSVPANRRVSFARPYLQSVSSQHKDPGLESGAASGQTEQVDESRDAGDEAPSSETAQFLGELQSSDCLLLFQLVLLIGTHAP